MRNSTPTVQSFALPLLIMQISRHGQEPEALCFALHCLPAVYTSPGDDAHWQPSESLHLRWAPSHGTAGLAPRRSTGPLGGRAGPKARGGRYCGRRLATTSDEGRFGVRHHMRMDV